MEGLMGRGPATARVLPLRFTGQAVRPPGVALGGQRRQLLAELDGLMPGHVLDREVPGAAQPPDLVPAAPRLTPPFVIRAPLPGGTSREVARVETHDLLELPLSHFVNAQ